jgi:hypothetical protein
MAIYDGFTLANWKSVPPVLKEYAAEGSVFVLPEGVSLSSGPVGWGFRTNDGGRFDEFLGLQTIHADAYGGVIAAYESIVASVAQNRAVMEKNYLMARTHRREKSRSARILSNLGIEISPDFPAYLDTDELLSKRNSCIRYRSPERLLPYAGQQYIRYYLKVSEGDMVGQINAGLAQLKKQHERYIAGLMADFEITKNKVMGNKDVIIIK